jgi:uracil-DNA glycosylase
MTKDPSTDELLELLSDSREHAKYLAELGVDNVALTTERKGSDALALVTDNTRSSVMGQDQPIALFASPRGQRVHTTITTRAASSPPVPQDSLFGDLAAPQPSLAPSRETLADIWRDIGECTRCGLCEGRTQVVNSHGNPKARLMFVGEAPGADEDAQGKPFVGRAGQLLTKIIEAIGLKREEVLIGNVNRCRPPGNRQPTLEEAAICRPFLFREISAVKPDVIVVLGNTALRNLLETREGITRVRGKFQDFRGIKVMPTFHPAYLLRDPSKKRETWEDLKKVRDYLDALPPRS